MLFRIFLLLLFPLFALAQDCDCCTMRDEGHTRFNAGNYAGAKSAWQKAKKMPDAAKCTDLDALIAKAQAKITPPKPKSPTGPSAAEQAARTADDNAWKYAQGSLNGCKQYLADYPNGRHSADANQCKKDYSDTDGDGIVNKDDRCPSEKGSSADSGCPPPAQTPVKITPVSKSQNNAPMASPVAHRKKSGLTMVPVEGDTYTMGGTGSDECPHEVKVNNYAIGQYEVTQADWLEVMGSNPSNFKDCAECPVEQVPWDDIQDFITKANQKYGRRFRLPTEAEWEFAARGGKKSHEYEYAGSNTVGDVAWYDDNSGSKTHEVGTKAANELGLYDMSGNVWEWCRDNWGPYPGCSDPKETDAARRVLRGGSWVIRGNACRVVNRSWDPATNRYYGSGFRLAQD